MTKVSANLKDQVAILHQEVKNLGKRSAIIDPQDAAVFEEAIIREIKRRRKDPCDQDALVSLDERRAADKASATFLIKENSNLLI